MKLPWRRERRDSLDDMEYEADRALYLADPSLAIDLGYQPPERLAPQDVEMNRRLQNSLREHARQMEHDKALQQLRMAALPLTWRQL